jgi:drug/metabolite transporter (DMT)-like permease
MNWSKLALVPRFTDAMNTHRSPLDARAVSLMLLLCVLWGGQQSVIKLVADDIAPTLQIALRSGIGMVLIAIFMWHRGISFALHRGPWRAGLLAGVMFASEFYFIGEGLRFTTASHMTVFLYTSPIFTALGLHFLLPEERLSWMQWAGITFCFGGITLAFLGGFAQPTINNQVLLGDFYALLAGMLWGLTTVVLRCTNLNRIPAAQTAQYQLITAFVVLLLATGVTGQWSVNWTPAVIAAVAAQGVIISFFTLLIWFWLLTHYLASRLASFTFITPIMGVAFGVVLLDDPLDALFIAGAVLVILGISVVNHPRARLRHQPKRNV